MTCLLMRPAVWQLGEGYLIRVPWVPSSLYTFGVTSQTGHKNRRPWYSSFRRLRVLQTYLTGPISDGSYSMTLAVRCRQQYLSKRFNDLAKSPSLVHGPANAMQRSNALALAKGMRDWSHHVSQF